MIGSGDHVNKSHLGPFSFAEGNFSLPAGSSGGHTFTNFGILSGFNPNDDGAL